MVLIRKYGDVYLARYHCVISIFELQTAGKSSAEIAKGPSVRSRACTCKSMFVCLFVMCVHVNLYLCVRGCVCVCVVCVYVCESLIKLEMLRPICSLNGVSKIVCARIW